MNDCNIKYESLSSVGFCKMTLPYHIFKTIKDEIDEIYNNKFVNASAFNERLAGHIEHEYILKKSVQPLEDFFNSILPSYINLMAKNRSQSLKLGYYKLYVS